MKIPERVIQKAIEGGWGKDSFFRGEITSAKWQDGKLYLEWYSGETESIHLYEEHWERLAFDTSFWQSLSKALGWRIGMKFADLFNARELSGWEFHAHSFFDLILTGQNTDAFWSDLVPEEK